MEKKLTGFSGKATRVCFVVLAAIILCFMGFYNNYPLLFPDTGTYIFSGFKRIVPIDRPIIYGLFLRYVSMAESLWLVILVQGMIVSLLLYYYFKYFSISRGRIIFFMAYIFLVTFFTGASVNVSQLIPDVFTSVVVMAFGLLLLVKELGIRDRIITIIFLVLGLSVHNSHILVMGPLLLLFTLLYGISRRLRSKMVFFKPVRLITLWATLVGAWLLIPTVHAIYGGGFVASKGGHVFLMARLNDIGVLRKYLDDKCGTEAYKFCEYRDQVPWDFIWDNENSPLYKTGGWEANREEYNRIIRGILSDPGYYDILVMRSVESGFKQFFTFETGDTPQLLEGTATWANLNKYFGEQLKEYYASRQANGWLDYTALNEIQKYLVAICLLFLLVALITDIPFSYKFFILFLLAILFMNAWVCGSLSGVFPRYQARLVWLLPLPVMLILTDPSACRAFFQKFRSV